MSEGPSLGAARQLDAEDPLGHFRERFAVEPDVVYFDGNSLGRLPRATPSRLAAIVSEEWGTGLVRSWDTWMGTPLEVGDRLGATMLGAAPGQVVVADTTTLNIFKLAHAGFDVRPGRTTIVTEAGGFPTNRYVLDAVARARGGEVRLVEEPGGGAIDDTTAIVSFSLVDYRSGALADLDGITTAAHEAGAVVLWDLSHAAGVVDVRLDAAGADFAAGCTYKYLNAGPGAPAFAYAASRHHDGIRPAVPGWFGHALQFSMAAEYRPAPGIRRLLTGTPDIRGIAAVDVGVSLSAEAGVAALRTKSEALTKLAVECVDAWLGGEVELASPRQRDRRGSHIALRHPQAWQICQALVDRHRVIPDFREPDIVRIGLAPIYTSFAETWAGLDAVRAVIEHREHEGYPSTRKPVT